MKRYAITSKLEDDGYIYAQVVDGNRLAKKETYRRYFGDNISELEDAMGFEILG